MREPVNRYLDGAVLHPELERARARTAIGVVIGQRCRTVCIRPCDLDLAAELCPGTVTGICVVLGFPHGCGLSAVKAREAEAYVAGGAAEIDMVANYGFIRSQAWDLVEHDIRAVTAVAAPAGVGVKVILETSALTLDQIRRATLCAIAAGADYVKTSTGFAGGGATVEAVQAMLEAGRGRIRVKASGGIREYAQARTYLDLGVDRLGVGYLAVPAICAGQGA